MTFSVKQWQTEVDPEHTTAPTTATPINGAALEDLETRLSGYTDDEIAAEVERADEAYVDQEGAHLPPQVVVAIAGSGAPTTGTWTDGQAVIDDDGITWVRKAGAWVEGSGGEGFEPTGDLGGDAEHTTVDTVLNGKVPATLDANQQVPVAQLGNVPNALIDTFPGTALNTGLWTLDAGVTASVASNQLTIHCNTSYNGVTSERTFDLTGAYIKGAYSYPAASQSAASLQLSDGAGGQLAWTNGNALYINDAGVEVDAGTSPAPAAGTVYHYRIREQAGTVYWDASPDGTTWTNYLTATIGALGLTGGISALRARLIAGYYGSVTTGVGIFSDIESSMVPSRAAAEPVYVIAASGAAATLVPGMNRVAMTANCVFALPTAKAGLSVAAQLKQDATGSRTGTFPGVKWGGATPPVLSAAANAVDVLSFICFDGTNWLGFVGGLAFA